MFVTKTLEIGAEYTHSFFIPRNSKTGVLGNCITIATTGPGYEADSSRVAIVYKPSPLPDTQIDNRVNMINQAGAHMFDRDWTPITRHDLLLPASEVAGYSEFVDTQGETTFIVRNEFNQQARDGCHWIDDEWKSELAAITDQMKPDTMTETHRVIPPKPETGVPFAIASNEQSVALAAAPESSSEECLKKLEYVRKEYRSRMPWSSRNILREIDSSGNCTVQRINEADFQAEQTLRAARITASQAPEFLRCVNQEPQSPVMKM